MVSFSRYCILGLPLISILVLFGLELHTVSGLSVGRNKNHQNGASFLKATTANSDPPLVSRRDWMSTTLVGSATGLLWKNTPASAETGGSQVKLGDEYFTNPVVTNPEAGRSYFPALTPPFSNRATYKYDLGRNTWALEQLLTFANVTATIRCNVVRLESTGGLWVHSPQWPTGEFCSLLDGIGGSVEHVVLPCNAFEHKAPMRAFLKKYPKAKVWVAPGQYGPLGESKKEEKKKPMQLTRKFLMDSLLFIG